MLVELFGALFRGVIEGLGLAFGFIVLCTFVLVLLYIFLPG